MTDGSSTMFAELPALREPNGSSSKTSPDYSPRTTGTLWPESVRRWPERVSADGNGGLYERPTSAPPTDASDGSVLPTPMARDDHGPSGRARDGGTCLPTTVLELLPTPTAANPNDGEEPDSWQARKDYHATRTDQEPTRAGLPLAIAVQLLPTPTSSDAAASGNTEAGNPGTTLTDACVRGLGAMPPPSSDGRPSPAA